MLLILRVLHLNISDTEGGAARAAYRLHSGLRNHGIDSRMLVEKKNSNDDAVFGLEGWSGKINSRIRRKINQLPVKRYRDREQEAFSPVLLPDNRAKQIARHDPDIVHLHWVAGGYIHPSTISQLDVPVVWTLHDMWPFTGGCHYSKSCIKYQSECGACPHLGSDQSSDLANSVWKKKQKAWDESEFVVVAPSQWLAQQAKMSSLLGEKQIEVIPNGLDMADFCPHNRTEGIEKFDLEKDKHYLLFGAAYETPRKGGHLLYETLEQLCDRLDTRILTFGQTKTEGKKSPLPARHLGWLSEDELQLAYSTADVMIVPSIQEAFGQTALESLASGTPVAAFNATGPRDIIDHKKTGYLAEPFDPHDLAKGICWILADKNRYVQLSQCAREVAQQRFAVETVANQYVQLYTELL